MTTTYTNTSCNSQNIVACLVSSEGLLHACISSITGEPGNGQKVTPKKWRIFVFAVATMLMQNRLLSYVNLFLLNVFPYKVWPNLFTKQKELHIEIVIHVTEICITVPLSNAETERVFSFL